MEKKLSVYDVVTSNIIAKLEQGTAPWRKPWACRGFASMNLVSGKPYRGVNVFSTAFWDKPFFVTFKQAETLGARVKKGAKSTPIIFWLKSEKKDSQGNVSEYMSPRFYKVFNVEQLEPCEAIDALMEKRQSVKYDHTPLEEAEKVIQGFNGPTLNIGNSDVACYSPALDSVKMPGLSQFKNAEDYYSVFFHELTHSTGHKDRLARDGVTGCAAFGSEVYSKEELVAEMGAAFLAGHCGITSTLDQSASYIKHWLAFCKQNPKEVVSAAAQAQKAADLILGVKFEKEGES